ncbi:hypothetical protein [Akkermansia sp.]|uniref:hypothetical protein n=1 Tax=Akkermansia sp. TaxID=1872421 RepID=UPI0026741717|nr:hypothetical protein [Akkermansia sp.]MEE0763533.1 hypothetical protein [Akkermansia sp.]
MNKNNWRHPFSGTGAYRENAFAGEFPEVEVLEKGMSGLAVHPEPRQGTESRRTIIIKSGDGKSVHEPVRRRKVIGKTYSCFSTGMRKAGKGF